MFIYLFFCQKLVKSIFTGRLYQKRSYLHKSSWNEDETKTESGLYIYTKLRRSLYLTSQLGAQCNKAKCKVGYLPAK